MTQSLSVFRVIANQSADWCGNPLPTEVFDKVELGSGDLVLDYLQKLLATKWKILYNKNNVKSGRMDRMKDLNLLVWLTQLGLSVAAPPAVFILLAVWLRNRFAWGAWVIWVAIALGIYCAVTGFMSTLRTLSTMAGKKKQEEPAVSFNDHD